LTTDIGTTDQPVLRSFKVTDIESQSPARAPSETLSPVVSRLLDRAQKELQSGDAEAATRTLSNVLSLAPESAEALRLMAIAAQNHGDHTRAVEYFRRALAACRDDADLLVGYGVALYQTGAVNEAISSLRRACELAPESASAWYNLAEALKPQVHTEEAIDALQRTLALDPSHLPAWLALARAWASLGRIDDAVSSLREILRREPGHAEAWYALSNLKTVALDSQDVLLLESALARRGLASGSGSRSRRHWRTKGTTRVLLMCCETPMPCNAARESGIRRVSGRAWTRSCGCLPACRRNRWIRTLAARRS